MAHERTWQQPATQIAGDIPTIRGESQLHRLKIRQPAAARLVRERGHPTPRLSVAAATDGHPAETYSAFELPREIERFEKDIVCFADEGSVWQFGLQGLHLTVGTKEAASRTEIVIQKRLDTCDQPLAREILNLASQPRDLRKLPPRMA